MLNIRPAVPEDIPVILDLIRCLAEYERDPQAAQATAADLLRYGWGAEPKFRCLIADWKSAPEATSQNAGFALYFYNYSTWRGRPGIYLEDLFVRPEYRRKGIATALFVYLAQLAVREQCGRFDWQVLNWNAPAIRFYESLGAKEMSEWRTMRLQDESLRRLAESASAASARPGTR